MPMNPTSATTMQSTDPGEDAEFLRKILPFSYHADGDIDRNDKDEQGLLSKSSSISLVYDDVAVLFIVPSVQSSGCAVFCLPDQETLEKLTDLDITWKDSEACLQVRETNVGELVLPSSARMLLVTPEVLQSTDSRAEISSWLAKCSSLESDGGSEAVKDNSSVSSPPSPVPDAEPKPPRFRTLQASLMGRNGVLQPDFPLNARSPIDFETDLFKGKVLCVVRPEDPSAADPYWNDRIFSQKKRRLVINVQGKFKYQPTGTVYAGAEISKPMKLGLVTRALAGVLLKFVDRFVSGVHSAFGDDKELAHIVAPAMGFFERIVITPPGESPPRIDEDIIESAESMADRKGGKSIGSWNTTDTFTFSFYSMNIDLPTWSLVGLPVSGDVSLKTFWGDSALKVCMYENFGGSDRHHRVDKKRYAFALQVQFMGRDAADLAVDDEEEEEEEDILRWSGRDFVDSDHTTNHLLRQSESQVFDISLQDLGDDSDAESLFFDAEQPKSGFDLGQSQRIPSRCFDVLSMIDGSCPCWIETISSRGNYTKAFAVNVSGTTMLRSVDDCFDLLGSSNARAFVDKTFSPRLSTTERTRRMVGWALAKPNEIGIIPAKLAVFQQRRRILTNDFLREDIKAETKLSGLAFRAVSDRHWIQELVKLTSTRITFYHPEKMKRTCHINLSNIVEVARLDAEDCPMLPGQFFLVLRLLGRSLYMMFGSEKDRERFIREALTQKVVKGGIADLSCSVNSESSTASRLALIDNPADEFMHKSSMWSCHRRRILNCGKFNFRHSLPSPNPLQLAEDALRQALVPANGVADEMAQRRSFLDRAALLKQADISDLSDRCKLAFFLNLYHLMVMHAYLILGPPDWSLKWISYFNSIAYEVSDDIFSLVELEHSIVRSKMSAPSQFMSRFVIPRSEYKVALSIADSRVNFALNCGSLSNPLSVLIYDSEKLDEQLTSASRLYLECVVVTRKNGRKIVVELPRVCDWYSGDFGTSEVDLLRHLEPYLNDTSREILDSCRVPETGTYEMDLITIRYQAYSYECRPLQLLE